LAGLRVERVVVAPARRCTATATAAGWKVDSVDTAWAELNFGDWAGGAFEDVARVAPAALAAWQADPLRTAPPNGETLAALAARVLPALDALHDRAERTVVVTHAAPIKLAVLHAVGAAPDRLWHVDIAPSSITELGAPRRRLDTAPVVRRRPPGREAAGSQTPGVVVKERAVADTSLLPLVAVAVAVVGPDAIFRRGRG
jgi:broad specificity phosphatase PhoE